MHQAYNFVVEGVLLVSIAYKLFYSRNLFKLKLKSFQCFSTYLLLTVLGLL
jgi:hypothetical protein